MRDLLKYSPYYLGALAVGILIAAIAGVYPSVIVLGVIIVLAFTVVVMVMRVGTHDDEPLHSGPSASVDFWSKLANKVEARQNAAAPAADVAAITGAVSDEAEKERKRQEALARKAARQAKPAGGDA